MPYDRDETVQEVTRKLRLWEATKNQAVGTRGAVVSIGPDGWKDEDRCGECNAHIYSCEESRSPREERNKSGKEGICRREN